MTFISCPVLLYLHGKKKLDIHSVSLWKVNAALKLSSLGSRLKLAATKERKELGKDPEPRKDTKDPRLLVP